MPHQRRKSGQISANSSSTDVRRAASGLDMTKHKRPGLSRKHTPVNAQKLGKSQRERERERQWDEVLNDERESFPQYCMTCEKQFVPYHDKHLYCSEHCRRVDQASGGQMTSPRHYMGSSYAYHSTGDYEPRDIIPQASPSRPNSMLFSNSPPTSPNTTAYHHTSAISALRSLNLNTRPPSPPSPTGSNGNFWPFSGRSAATSPSTSYTRPSAPFFSSTYDGAYTTGGYTYDSAAMERPLPSRHPSSQARPKSIELVTPMVSGR